MKKEMWALTTKEGSILATFKDISEARSYRDELDPDNWWDMRLELIKTSGDDN